MSFKNCIKSKVKNIDLFGRPVIINYNKKGINFTTIIGGIISILIYLLVLTYGIERIVILIKN